MTDPDSQRSSLREANRAAFRAAIVCAAEAVFQRDGYQAAKMAAIAREAGVASGTLYNYFKSKQEIFTSIMEAGAAEFARRIDAAGETDDPIARLRQIVRTSLEFLDEHGSLFAIYVQLQGGPELESFSSALTHPELRRRHFELLEHTVAEAQSSAQLRADLPAAALVLALSGVTNAFVVQWTEQGCVPGELTPALDTIFELFTQGSGPQ